MPSLMDKKAVDLTVGDQLKVSGIATGALVAFTVIPLVSLAVVDKISTLRAQRKARKASEKM